MEPSGSERYPKTARLRKRPQFLKLSQASRKVSSAHFVVISSTNDAIENRLGITVSGKVGNAVARNRIKRHVREFFRRHRCDLPKATDYLIIARNGAAALNGSDIDKELHRALPRRRGAQRS